MGQYQPVALTSPQPKQSTPRELRGVWLTNVDSDVLFNPNTLKTALERLKTLNFNTLYPTIWNWGYTLYPSTVAQEVIGTALDPEPGLAGRDMLQEIIDQGHRHHLTVIPWFEFGFMAPADSALAQRHPDWLTQRIDGSTIWSEGGIHDRVWLNPLHPEVQDFITRLVVEVVEKYDLDGIQFDDHFGYPSDFGYDDYTVRLYRQEHGGHFPANQFDQAQWIRWRADKITQFMEKLFFAIKGAKQQAIVSLAPNPQDFSLNSYLLDWHQWERKGLIEELVVQLYRNDLSRFREELADSSLQQARQHIPVAIGILSGLKGRYVPLNQIDSQVKTVRNGQFAGMSFFFYESLWNYADESPEQRQRAFRRWFPQPATHPSVYDGWSEERVHSI
ncbi:glycoside hydrolase family 10 protein [Spirulina subsalsa]|uniref:glycoside hydrolase family 10 protein n=1 Tax=Spirulina subsalsa TaxID=54311 RepID=UPI0038B379CD